MPFRAYVIDSNEHVRTAVDIAAVNPDEAVRKAAVLRGENIVEVWQLEKKSGEPRPLAAAV